MKNKMTLMYSAAIFVFVMLTFPALCQNRTKEIGISLTNLNNGFGLNYKTGTDQSLWRFTSMFIGGSTRQEEDLANVETSIRSHGFDLRAGKEYRKELLENLQFRMGFDVSITFNRYETETKAPDESLNYSNTRTDWSPGIDGVFGINYVVKDKLVFGFEITPGIGYVVSKSKIERPDQPVEKKEATGINWGISTNSVLLSVAYRIRKE